jgi:hypothetical protein
VARGGWRPGGGRPTKAQQAEKARLLAETIARGAKTSPRAYLQGLLDSPGSSKSEKLTAAELLLKLPPEASPSSADMPVHVWNIWGLPHGAQIGDDGKTIVWDDGTTEPAQPLEPFEASPAVVPTPRRREPEPEPELPEPAPFETVEATPPQNVLPLRPHERVLSFGAQHDPSRRPEAMDPFRFKPRD